MKEELGLKSPTKRVRRQKVKQPKRTVPIPQEVAESILARAVEVYGTETVDELRNTSIKDFKIARQAVVAALIEAGKRRGEKYSQGSIGEVVGFSTPSSVANAIRSTRKLKGEEKEMLEEVISAIPVKTPDIAKLRNEVFGPGKLPAGWKRTSVAEKPSSAKGHNKALTDRDSLEARPLSVEDGFIYAVWRQGNESVANLALYTGRSETDVAVALVRVAEFLRKTPRLEQLAG